MAKTLGPMAPIRSPETISNIDIRHVINRCDLYMRELVRSGSSSSHSVKKADITRITAMAAAMRKRIELFSSTTEGLDMPKYSPNPLADRGPPIDLVEVENPDIQSLVDFWAAMRVECSLSDSADDPTGFTKHDGIRVKAMMDHVDALIKVITEDPDHDMPDVNLQSPSETQAQE